MAAGKAWTSFHEVKGWAKPSKAEVPDAVDRFIELRVYGIGTFVVLSLSAIMLALVWPQSPLTVAALVILIVLTTAAYLPVVRASRQMAEVLDSLAKGTELTPEEAVARTESALVAARMPFTRLSREDPGRYWKDHYAETFTIVSGGTVRVRLHDEGPSGTGNATKVYVGPANAETERLVSTLAWHLDKALPKSRPQQ